MTRRLKIPTDLPDRQPCPVCGRMVGHEHYACAMGSRGGSACGPQKARIQRRKDAATTEIPK